MIEAKGKGNKDDGNQREQGSKIINLGHVVILLFYRNLFINKIKLLAN